MSISYRCPTCGRIGEVDDDLAGQRINCPSCETEIGIAAAPGRDDDDFMPLAELQQARRNETFAEEARADQTIEWQRELLKESRDQSAHLKKIADNTGCIFIILAIWFFLGIAAVVMSIVGAW
ncbi:hypothetical protein NG895_03475 [Aeoliella sp. ICT_H6.2]|uniref:Uncharacterized protein n=1 Tax=Aeoliella straminimaris TaxID=2954799 RepID=A0A9X2F676_9BACT|nr:hypothetical protein [Aeoliella straminimaris]MCO6042960.1 hypothetical protein [Aeoliella straminimaris]